MARVVYKIFGITDKNENLLRSIVLSKEGLSIENVKFMLEFKTKKYKDLFEDLIFYDELIKYIDDYEDIKNEIDNFEQFKKQFLSIFVTIRDKKPELANKIYNHYKKNYTNCYGIYYQVEDRFIDYKHKEISFKLDTNNEIKDLNKSFVLVPEVAHELYDVIKRTVSSIVNDSSKSVNVIIELYIVKQYYENYLELYPDDEVSKKYLNEINNKLRMIKNAYPAIYSFASEKIIYSVKPSDNIYYNIEKFIVYILEKFFNSKNVAAFEKICKILSSLDSANPDHKYVLDGFAEVLIDQNLIDEYNAFTEMRVKNEDKFIISKLLYHFYPFYSSDEYKEMLSNYNSNQRTQSDD